ncbi:PI-PLC X domain-containing protein 3-like [Mercenaria mercenaria]|uniref:PI-PLC X domain-containing protein 3-like n=1 Tax=Mercenaria mercenaria TaxID=6596 RepID=UPI00234F97B7|nr:PI-PLC X domain-containing protein 3-like [Mercenaria mercenaria]
MQLSSGIRYFDLRVASRSGTPNIHFLHTLYGTTVKEGLDEIIDFLDDNKKEIVILDFNHFYQMCEDQHQEFLKMLIEKCGEKLCLFVGIENLTLNMLWENGLQIIIVYHHKIAAEICHVWPGSTCVSYWPETTNVHKMFDCLNNVTRKENEGHFKVCQCVLTPDTGYILKHMNGSILENFAKKVMPDVMRWLARQKRGKCGINIVIVDHIELDEFAKSVISLNFC